MNLFKLKLYINTYKNGISLLDIPIVSHCNLNCKYCNALSPIAKKSFVNVSQYEKDIEKLSILFTDKIKKIHILGGEPLLHTDLIKIIEITRHFFKKSDIHLITNGTLLKEQNNNFFKVIEEQEIVIDVSEYPIVSDIKSQVKINISKKNKMFKPIFDLYGSQDPERTYEKCNVCEAFTFYDSKLYTPCLDPYTQYLVPFLKTDNLPKEHGLSIFDYNSYKDLLIDLFSKRPDTCRFCKKIIYDLPWELSDKNISEYTDL